MPFHTLVGYSGTRDEGLIPVRFRHVSFVCIFQEGREHFEQHGHTSAGATAPEEHLARARCLPSSRHVHGECLS